MSSFSYYHKFSSNQDPRTNRVTVNGSEPHGSRDSSWFRAPRIAGVQIKETDRGQPCTECSKCIAFEPHSWRKNCKNCKCLREGHEIVAEHGARSRLGLNLNHDGLDARSLGYTFVPAGLTTARQVDQYYSSLPTHEVPKLGSKGETARLQRIVRQLPKQDLALSACKFVEESVKSSYQDFISARNEIALDIGIAKPAPPNSHCDGCNRPIPNQQVSVVAPRMGTLIWHPACFRCTTCDDLLVDLSYCVYEEKIYCERHYAELLKPRCEGCDEISDKYLDGLEQHRRNLQNLIYNELNYDCEEAHEIVTERIETVKVRERSPSLVKVTDVAEVQRPEPVKVKDAAEVARKERSPFPVKVKDTAEIKSKERPPSPVEVKDTGEVERKERPTSPVEVKDTAAVERKERSSSPAPKTKDALVTKIDVKAPSPPETNGFVNSESTEKLVSNGHLKTNQDLEISSRSRSASPIPQHLAEELPFRRSPSPYPNLVLSAPRNSICNELLENVVPEVDEESISRSSTPEKLQLILESKHNTTEYWKTKTLVVPPSKPSFYNSDSTASFLEFSLESKDNEIEPEKFDEQFLDSLDGVKKKKLTRSSSTRRSRKKRTNESESKDDSLSSSVQNNDTQTAKTLTEAANVLKNVNQEADGPSSSTGTSKDTAEPFWLIFSGEYTKAMNKDWHGQHFCCWQCDESLTGQRYVLRDDHPYCVSCYESVFANACEKCSRIIGIDSKDLSYKDKHWHEACFLCTTCGESLVDRQFGSKGDRIYCGRCYDEQFASRCDGCHEIFRAGTKKMEYKTRQWHEKCFCCCVCKVPIGTQSFIPREQEIYCAKCYEEKFATRCIKCNKVITSGGVTYKNEPWHRECFTCTHCSKSLAGERFTSRDEKPYCAECFGELFAKRCFACNKPITGIGGTKFISFEDRHWHNDCFFCASCRTSLVGRGFITDQDDIICPECAKQKLM